MFKGFGYAISGIAEALKTQVNMKIHAFATVMVVALGFILKVSSIEWVLLIFSCGIVIFCELLNTAIEYFVDLASPDIHPVAGKIKDLSAGAVLVAAITALVAGCIIFIPKVMHLLHL